MTRDQIETLKGLGETGYQQFQALNRLNLKTWSELADRQKGLFDLLLDNGMRQCGQWAETLDDPSRLLDGQMKLGRELVSRNHDLLTHGQEIGMRYLELFEDGARRTTEALNPETRDNA